jgi:hypothetical protein
VRPTSDAWVGDSLAAEDDDEDEDEVDETGLEFPDDIFESLREG